MSARSFLSCVAAVLLLTAGPLLGEETCRFLSPDFPKIGAEARTGTPWDVERLQHFVADEGTAVARFLVAEDIVCVSFQTLPASRRLHDLAHLTENQHAVAPEVWRGFLEELESLSCEAILNAGKSVRCPEVRRSNFIDAARKAATQAKIYDSSYQQIPNVDGDVPAKRGVCSDVIVRALRQTGIDLQSLVQESIRKAPNPYALEEKWHQLQPDPNIDHRRVVNLMVYFEHTPELFLTLKEPDRDWWPGDIAVWNLRGDSGFLPHIGVISDRQGESGDRLVIHHLPPSGSEDDRLHAWKILGHYRPLF